MTEQGAGIAVVGGGYAGMAAAFELARRGRRVTVYEAARQLGGRARAVPRDGRLLDNGQHILIGAYRDLLGCIEAVGRGDGLLRLPLAWRIWPDFELRARNLPAPWHLAAAFLLARGMAARERVACVRFFAWAMRARFRIDHDISVAQLLEAHRQPPNAVARLWAPLCVAALNTAPEEASAQVFLNVVRDGLFAARAASDIVLPRVDLGALFPEPAAEYVRSHGGEVRLGTAVTRIDRDGDGFIVATAAASVRHAAVAIATPPYRVPAIAGHLPQLAPEIAAIAAMTYRAIVTVYLQYPSAPAQSWPMLGASGRMQWLFDRGLIAGQQGLLAAVISGHARTTPHAGLAREVEAEIAAIHPDLEAARWSQVIEEKRATFACTPGLQRPSQATAIPALYLAGDYTDADYPGTLEAAVRSGRRSAELLCGAPG